MRCAKIRDQLRFSAGIFEAGDRGEKKKELGHHLNELGDNKECQIGAKGIRIEYGR